MEAGQSGVSGVAVWLPVETVPGKEPGNVTIPNHSLEVGIVVEVTPMLNCALQDIAQVQERALTYFS